MLIVLSWQYVCFVVYCVCLLCFSLFCVATGMLSLSFYSICTYFFLSVKQGVFFCKGVEYWQAFRYRFPLGNGLRVNGKRGLGVNG